MTVRDLLEMAAGKPLEECEVCALVGKVGLCASEYIDREVDASLSGGEAKRIEIATVLARGAKLSIFDEPEAGIDLWSFSKLVETFQELQKSHQGTLLIISHQERILSIADEIVVIADGVVREAGPREKVMPHLMMGESMGCMCPLGAGGAPRMNNITDELLRLVAGFKGEFTGAYNIREDGRLRRAPVYPKHQNRIQDRQARH